MPTELNPADEVESEPTRTTTEIVTELVCDMLAQDIRKVDSNHDLGAGALAERLAAMGWRKVREELRALRIKEDEQSAEIDRLKAKLYAIGSILPSSACDLRKLQNIEGVLNGTFQPEYFTNPTHPGD